MSTPLTQQQLYDKIDEFIGTGADTTGPELNVLLKDHFESLEQIFTDINSASSATELARAKSLGVQLIRLHSELLTFKGFVSPTQGVGGGTERDAYIVTESGQIPMGMGYVAATQGQVIHLKGGTWLVEDMNFMPDLTDLEEAMVAAQGGITNNATDIDNLFNESWAKAVQLLRLHNEALVFRGFANAGDPTPAHHNTHAWIAANNGTIFGLPGITSGQIIWSDGTGWVVEEIGVEGFAQAQADIDALEAEMSTAQGQITTLQGRMNNAEGDIDWLMVQDYAQAVQLVRLHNPELVFQFFVDAHFATPLHVANNAYIAAINGTIFDIAGVKAGQIIRSTGSAWVVEDIETTKNEVEATAIQLLSMFDSRLIFQGFAFSGDTAPSPLGENHAYVAADSGIMFGKTVKKGQILAVREGLIAVHDVNFQWLEPISHYGVQWDVTQSSPALTRIGNVDLHKTLPIQGEMKRCLLSNAGDELLLDANDSSLLADGSPADLSGAAGQLMVRIPEFWYKVEVAGNLRRVKIAQFPFPGYRHSRKAYMSIDCATIHRPTLTLASVVSSSADFRGGNNTAAWDEDPEKTLIGKPATNISRTNFRTYARNRGAGWQMLPYHVYNAAVLLYFVEYANFNSQLAFNPALTAEGFRQGGLGAGVTGVSSSNWNTWNSYNPFVPIAHTLDLGNNTGVKDINIRTFTNGAITQSVPSYRGIANFFGHIWQNADGLLVSIQAEDAGGLSELFVTENPLHFSDSVTSNMIKVGNLLRANGYIKDVILGDRAIFAPMEGGGGSTTYFCDYWYTSIPSTGVALRTLLLGGNASYGAFAGVSFAYSNYSPASATAFIGSRLCFLT